MADQQLEDTSAAVAAYLNPQASDPAMAARVSMNTAIDANPEFEAQLRQAAQRTGVPLDAARSYPDDVKRQAALANFDFDQMASQFPRTAAYFADVDRARLAHDDTGTLTKIEAALSYLWGSTKAGVNDLAGAGAKLADVLNPFTLSEQDAAVLYRNDPQGLRKMRDESASMFLSRFANARTRAANQNMADISPEAKDRYGSLEYATTDTSKAAYLSPVKMVGDAVRSLPTTLALAVTTILTRGAATRAEQTALANGLTAAEAQAAGTQAAIQMATRFGAASEGSIGYAQQALQTQDQIEQMPADKLEKSPTYRKLIDQGYAPEAARLYIAAHAGEQAGIGAGAVDAATNAVGGQFLGRLIGEGGKFLPRIGKGFLTEGATEFVQSGGEQLAQNAAVQAHADPSQELGDGVLESMMQGLFVGGLTGGTFAGAAGRGHSLVERMRVQDAAAAEAQAGAASLQDLDKLAAESRLRQRDPDSFREFVRQATEDGPVQDVYVDANTFAQAVQSAPPGVQAAIGAIPELAAQLPEALAAGGDIRIPIDQYATSIAGTDFAQSLLPHLKTDPAGMTQAEAQTYMQSHAQVLQAEVESTLAMQQGDEAFKASRDVVTAQVLEQLQGANRFTADVNQAYTSMVGNFYAVQAARLGITPEEMAKRYPLQVRAEQLVGQNTLEQAPVPETEAFKNWFGDSKVMDAGGKPLVMYHGTSGSQGGEAFTSFDTYASNYGLMGMGSYFTADPTVASSYTTKGKGQTPTVYPVYLSIKNPLDMDAKADSAAWSRQFPDAEAYHEGGDTNESWFRAAEDALADEQVPRAEGAEIMQEGLRAMGFDGITHIGGGRHGASDGTKHRVFIAFDPEQIKSATGNNGEFNPTSPNILAQEKRGSITFADDITQQPSVISLFNKADLSTFLHESGHFFLEVTNDMARREDAPPAVRQDMDALLTWFGVPDLAAWNAMDLEQKRPYHEQLARGFEAYLFEGKAPNVELQSLFQRIRAWMLNVYRSMAALNVTLTDEVRGVFDRMLASSETIAEAEQARKYGAMFETKPEFMSATEWENYQALGRDATQDAVHDLETRSLRDMRWLSNARGRLLREMQRDAASKRKAVRAEVSAEVMAEPVNLARNFLKRGEIQQDGETLKADGPHKLNIDALAEMYGGEGDRFALLDWSKLGYGAGGMLAKDGIHPDTAAAMFGYSSGDQLVHALLNEEPAAEKIEGITDQRMLERYGDLTDAASIARAADAALHNEARMRFVATELNAMNKSIGARPVLARAAREFAEATVARLRVRDLRPSQYAAAAARAARQADAAFKKGDIEAAATAKRNQLVNGYADRAAHQARTEVEKAVDYFNKFDREGVRKSLDTDYLEQIDALLARFDLRKGQSLKAIDKRRSLAEWAESQKEQGLEPSIPGELLNEVMRKSFKDMTVEEVRGLRDTVKQIEHLARLKHKLLTAKDQRDYEAIRDNIASSIIEHAGDRTADTRTPTTNWGRAAQGLRRFWSAHIKVATYARVMDGGKDGGPVWEYFVRSANEAGDRETTMRADATRALSEVMAPVFKLGKMGGKGVYFPSIDRSLNREARLAIALNTGNTSNLQRLLGGEGWTRAQIQPVLDSLSKQEWDAVQGIWDHFESYRPEIGAKERRVYGKEPEWIEAAPVQTAFGEYRGGYYPVKYDPAASQRAEEHSDAEGAKRQLKGAYTSATTRRSFTKARAEEVVGRPLLYSLSGTYSGVNDIIHDLSWHEWLIDVNRLLRSTAIDNAIRSKYGPEVKAQFKTWAADIAEGERGAQNAAEAALGKLRQNVSVAGLGYNFTSAAMQGLGLTQSIVRVGAAPIARGVVQYLSGPVDATRSVNERSEFMAARARTRYRELNELRNRVQGESSVGDAIKQHAYVAMMRFQQMVDVPTWLGAYEKAVRGGNDEARAIALADQAVIDAQGGGQTKDLAAIERGGPALKLFTTFYSFMNTALNIGVAQTMTPQSRAKLAADYLLLYSVPAVLGFMLKNAITPGDSGDGDDLDKLAAKLAAEQLSYLMGLFVIGREFAEAGKALLPTGDKGRDYAGPSGVRFIGDVYNFGKQAKQGEFDDAFRKALVNLTGDTLGLPSAQINRTITGGKALAEGKTENPAALLFGYQEKR